MKTIPHPTPTLLPDPSPITTQEISWVVISPDSGVVYFALTPKEYEELSLNMTEILRWVKEARWRLDYYKQNLGGGKKP